MEFKISDDLKRASADAMEGLINLALDQCDPRKKVVDPDYESPQDEIVASFQAQIDFLKGAYVADFRRQMNLSVDAAKALAEQECAAKTAREVDAAKALAEQDCAAKKTTAEADAAARIAAAEADAAARIEAAETDAEARIAAAKTDAAARIAAAAKECDQKKDLWEAAAMAKYNEDLDAQQLERKASVKSYNKAGLTGAQVVITGASAGFTPVKAGDELSEGGGRRSRKRAKRNRNKTKMKKFK